MKRSNNFLFTIFFGLTTIMASAQKKPLDNEADLSWLTINDAKISNDGKYMFYRVDTHRGGHQLIIKSVDNSWNKEMDSGVRSAVFSEDSHLLVLGKGRDSVGIYDITQNNMDYITHVLSYEISPDGKYLVYILTQSSKELIVRNLLTEKETKYSNVNAYNFSPKGNMLILQKEQEKSTNISLLEINTGQLTSVGNYIHPDNFIFDEDERKLVFLAKTDTTAAATAVLGLYQPGSGSASIVVSQTSSGMNNMLMSSAGRCLFSKDGNKFFFHIENKKQVDQRKKDSLISDQVNIWQYKENSLGIKKNEGPYLAVVNLKNNNSITRLENNDFISIRNINPENNSDYLLAMGNSFQDNQKYKFRQLDYFDLYIISSKDGSRKLIKNRCMAEGMEFSPSGKYAVWFDKKEHQWYSYTVKQMAVKNITAGIPTILYMNFDRNRPRPAAGMVGWTANSEYLLIYDNYDIWQLDPAGINKPICMTKGYGNKNHIKFKYENFQKINNESIALPDTLLLGAFNVNTKESGYYSLTLNGEKSVLTKLLMSPRLYHKWTVLPAIIGYRAPITPIKARDTNKYIISCMSATEALNLYSTINFKVFTALTDFAPQRNYNWYTTELIKWTLPDGKPAEGILYRPENFDTKKKYPVIFYYYENETDALNGFLDPVLSNGALNIPWYVSNEYLVFVPGIHYKFGYTGESAYTAVVSAAKYLSQYSWINKNKMGLQGHSHGGFETNYIIGRTSMFVAASSSSGISNVISGYGATSDRSGRRQMYYEEGQGNIGATLWQHPEFYIDNSAVFRADKVKTPLLLMHNEKDGVVYFNQATEWYSHLSYLGKKVWLLSYDDEGHTIDVHKNQLDYTIRLQQFFDHYLKDKPAPIWMTQGVPYSNKRIISGLQLDTSVQTP
jgi:dipeptidyl aminopeptidase/acylaminoacyl peptidase